jgi:SAM-dependent methyltransferase
VRHEGVVLERFMDKIFVPAPLTHLTPVQIGVVNAIRERVLDLGTHRVVNDKVKRTVAEFLERTRANPVLEWGCGYSSIGAYLPEAHVDYADVDSTVVDLQRAAGRRCYLADVDDSEIPSLHYEAVISVFVWHFAVSVDHLSSMFRVLRHDGFVLANIYRRDHQSKAELAAEVRAAGFAVRRYSDRQRLCRNHEYWLMSKDAGKQSRHALACGLFGDTLPDLIRS